MWRQYYSEIGNINTCNDLLCNPALFIINNINNNSHIDHRKWNVAINKYMYHWYEKSNDWHLSGCKCDQF